MKRFIQVASVIIGLILIMGVLSRPELVQAHRPSSMHSDFIKTGIDKSTGSVQSVLASGKLLPNVTPSGGLVTLGAWRNMRPTESYLRDVSMLPAAVAANVNCSDIDQQSKGWIVGDGGVILSYCHGIWDHSITTESIPTSLYGVADVTPTLAFAVGENGTILQYGWDTIEQKYVWVKLPIQVSQHTLNRISIVPNGSGYYAWVVGDQDDVLKRSTLVHGDIMPSGVNDPNHHPIYIANWTNVTNLYGSLPQTNMYFGVQVLTTNNAWTVASDYTNWQGYAMHWNGSTWSSYLVGKDPLYGVYFNSANDGWAVGEGGGIYHFNGSSWSKADSPISTPLADVSFDSTTEIGWAIGFDGAMAKYVGGKWTLFTDLRTDYFDFYGLDFTSGHGWMVGYDDSKKDSNGYGIGGQILEYSENAWLSVTVPTDNSLNDLKVLSDTNAWAVGAADKYGATIVHWDGRHWQRWFQSDLPLPMGDLYAIDMLSATNGWAAGEPPLPGAAAVFLHWDGRRWAPPRYEAPVNVRVNALSLIRTNIGGGNMADFGWAIADWGNAVAKLDYTTNYWNANHTYQGIYYQLRGLSLIPSTSFLADGRDWDAWAVGRFLSNGIYTENFLRFLKEPSPSTGYSWQPIDAPSPCPGGANGPQNTDLYSIRMLTPNTSFPTLGGFASGEYSGRASLYQYNGSGWDVIFCQSASVANPSQLNSVDVFEDSRIVWVGGYYTSGSAKVAFIAYVDQNGYTWGGVPFPLNGRNIYDRPISKLRMSNETMGWAVGEHEDLRKISALYQYPYPNFILNLSPAIGVVRPASSLDFTANLSSLGSIDNNVNLTALSVPTGFSVQITPSTVSSSSAANIHISVDGTVTPGTYLISMEAYANIMSGDVLLPMYRITPLTIIVTDHPIQQVVPDHGPSGTIVTITGQNLGTIQPGQRSTSINNVYLAGKQMPDASVISWTDTQIQVRVPDNAVLFPDGPVKDMVRITATKNNITGNSNGNIDFQLENHLSIVAISSDSNNNTIVINGTSLGNDPGYLNRDTDYEHITLDGVEIAYVNVLTWSDNQISFQVPVTTNIRGKTIIVTSNGYQSNEIVLNSPHVFLPIVIH